MDLHFVPFPGPSSSGDQVLGKRGHCNLLPPLSLLLGFLGVKLAHLLRCAVCLFWGADLWLRPAWWMSTIQNPKKSWLATKPACSLVDDASLGLQLPLLALAAPTCLSPAGDGLVRSWLALLSPLFCEQAWQCLRVRAFHRIAIPQSGLLSEVSSLGLPSGHSGLVLTLSNAAHASLPSPCLLVVDVGFCTASLLGVTIWHEICGF